MGYALQRREAVVVEDLATEKRFRPPALLPEHGVVSGATIAIPGRERPLGVLGVYTTRRRTFSPDDIYVLEAVTNILALAVRRVTAEREQAQLLASEQAARAQAEQARRRQEIFMAVVAHDLRGPLTAIRGYAQLLKRFETLSSERRAQAISTILGEVDRLNRLIGDLLDFSRVVAGRLRIAPRPVDLVGLARQVVEAQQMTTAAHQLILDAPPRVQGIWDPDRLAQVLTNLVSNAIKYSPEGGNVWVRLRPLDDEVEISVTDQGVGMTPEERARPFEPFARLERTRSLKGVGLGLFIAKGIVEAHGGRIWAESAGPGKGSTFFVTLPRRPPGKL
jgi:signal transduction histidine kinase